MNYKQLLEKFDDKNKLYALLNADEIVAFERIANGNDRQANKLLGDREAYKRALLGDFSMFERLSGCARVYFATKYMNEKEQELKDGGRYKPLAEVGEFLKKNAFDPRLRLGLSVAGKSYEEEKMLNDYDDYMNSYIMLRSLEPPTSKSFNTYINAMREETVSENEAIEQGIAAYTDNIDKQITMAKVLVLGRIAKPRIINYGFDKDGKTDKTKVFEQTYNGSFANAMAHCSRVSFILPAATHGTENSPSRSPIHSVMGINTNDKSGIYKRSAATHSVKKRVVRDGRVESEFEELKGVAFSNQYGMDVAIGGLGNPGISGAMLRTNGTCGHMYIHAEDGYGDERGAMLIGFESDSPTAEGNQQGHTHTWTAKPEKMSSFLGQRTGEIGEKYGGRQVDLTSTDAVTFDRFMNEFEGAYRALQVKALEDNAARRRLSEINGYLCGNSQDVKSFVHDLVDIGMNPDIVCTFVSDLRRDDVLQNVDMTNVSEADKSARAYAELWDSISLMKPAYSERIARPDMAQEAVYEDYRHKMSNSVRRSMNVRERIKDQSVERAKINEKYLTNTVRFKRSDIGAEGLLNDSMFPGMLAGDVAFGKYAETVTDNIDMFADKLKPAVKAIAEGMKELSVQIAQKGIEAEAYERASKSHVIIKPEDMMYITGEEINAAAAAVAGETRAYKAIDEKHFNTLKKVYEVLSGNGSLNSLNTGERAYLSSFMSKRGVQLEGNTFRQTIPDDRLIVTLGEKRSIKSLDAWKEASEEELCNLFKNKFLSNGAVNNTRELLGKDIYDCMYVFEGFDLSDGGHSSRHQSMKAYYKDRGMNEQQMQADFMRRLIKNEISAGCVMYDNYYEPHTAKIQINSTFKENIPKRHFWSKGVDNFVSANDAYANKVNQDISQQKLNSIKEESTVRFTGRAINRVSLNTAACYVMENAAAAQRCINNKVNESLARAAGEEQRVSLSVSPVEVQLYMLSKGLSLDETLSVTESEAKERLINEYYNLKAEPESREYRAAIEGMKLTLASAVPPSGDLGNKDVILNNYREISWLNSAAKLFTECEDTELRNFGDAQLNSIVNNIQSVTDRQIVMANTYASQNFKKAQIGYDDIKDALDAKVYLTACTAAGMGSATYAGMLGIGTQLYGMGTSETARKFDLCCDRWIMDEPGIALKLIEGGETADAVKGLKALPIMSLEDKYAAFPQRYGAPNYNSEMQIHILKDKLESLAADKELSREEVREQAEELMNMGLNSYYLDLSNTEAVKIGKRSSAFPLMDAQVRASIADSIQAEREKLTECIEKSMNELMPEVVPEKQEEKKTAAEADSEIYYEQSLKRQELRERYSLDTEDTHNMTKTMEKTVERIYETLPDGAEEIKIPEFTQEFKDDAEFARTDYEAVKTQLEDKIAAAMADNAQIEANPKHLKEVKKIEKEIDKMLSMQKKECDKLARTAVRGLDGVGGYEKCRVADFTTQHKLPIGITSVKELDKYFKDNAEKPEIKQLRDEKHSFKNALRDELRAERARLSEKYMQNPERQEKIAKLKDEIVSSVRLDETLKQRFENNNHIIEEARKGLKELEERYNSVSVAILMGERYAGQLRPDYDAAKAAPVQMRITGNALAPAQTERHSLLKQFERPQPQRRRAVKKPDVAKVDENEKQEAKGERHRNH